jgi:2,3-bisphosphoglycerate-dependent phosphoglycerate mutase
MPSTLVLLRHGESTWNRENRFTGWHDVPLTDSGLEESRAAAETMAAENVRPGVLHTSVLLRAIQTANSALEVLHLAWLPVHRSWRLNERHYGALQGLNKAETAERFGEEQVKVWRRSYDVRPPTLDPSDERHPRHDPRYAELPPDVLPGAECLQDVTVRMLPYWHDVIVPDLRAGRVVFVVAHGNSLRALVKHLDGVSDQEIVELNIPTGIPLVYSLDENLWPLERRYLGDPQQLAARADAVARQGARHRSEKERGTSYVLPPPCGGGWEGGRQRSWSQRVVMGLRMLTNCAAEVGKIPRLPPSASGGRTTKMKGG